MTPARMRSSSPAAPISTRRRRRCRRTCSAPSVTVLCQNEIRPGGDLRRPAAAPTQHGCPHDPQRGAGDGVGAGGAAAARRAGRQRARGAGRRRRRGAARPNDSPACLAERHGLTCVVTLGGAGCIAVGPALAALRVPALLGPPVDTTGAGDAFVGALAAWLDEGAALTRPFAPPRSPQAAPARAWAPRPPRLIGVVSLSVSTSWTR